jgi:hypothetical protein
MALLVQRQSCRTASSCTYLANLTCQGVIRFTMAPCNLITGRLVPFADTALSPGQVAPFSWSC